MEVLTELIRETYRDRKNALDKANSACRSMLQLSKEDYLFTKRLKDQAVKYEARTSMTRHDQKIRALEAEQRFQSSETSQMAYHATRERVTCVDVELSSGEKKLLSWGPKFVPSKGRLTQVELKALESQIETTASALRRVALNAKEENVGSESESEALSKMRSILTQPKLQKLIMAGNSQVKQPERCDPECERRIASLKEAVMRAYKRFRPSSNNISESEKKTLITLKERKDVIIKCSDKSKSLVAMKTETYHEKVTAILEDTENYEFIDMTSDCLESRVEQELKKIKPLKDKLPRNLYRELFPKNTRLPEFYGLPKVHKPGTPLRPVVAAFGGPLAPVSMLMERMLNQLLQFVPAHIRNTHEATRTLERTFPGLRTPTGTVIVTMDVVALYPSIPINDGIAAVLQKLEEHQDEIDMVGLSLQEVERILQLILNNNYFTFDGKVYRQKHGIAMGNHLAPPLAIIFMDSIERQMIRTAEKKPDCYDRYVDDCMLVWTHGQAELHKFLTHCNQQHPNIRFTWETSVNAEVSFMDMSLTVSENEIKYRLFQKPSDSGVTLNFDSAIPMSTKIAVAVQQFRRAALLSSGEEEKLSSFEKIEQLLRQNGYPRETMQIARTQSAVTSKQRKKTDALVTLKLPFRSDRLHKQVQKAVSQLELPATIRLIYTQGSTLKHHLVRSAFVQATCKVHEKYEEQQRTGKRSRGKPRDDCLSCRAGLQQIMCDQKNIVYSLECRLCGAEYVGETKRTARARMSEHHAQARNKICGTPWGDHMTSHHPQVTIEKVPIFHRAVVLAVEENNVTRKSREAVEIRDRKPSVNKCKGWHLT